MRRYEPYAGRRMLLIAADGLVAAMVGYFFAQRSDGVDVTTFAALMALSVVATLSALGAYSRVLQHPNSWHRYCSGLAAVTSTVPRTVLAWKHQGRLTAEEILMTALLVFAGLLVPRLLLSYAHGRLCRTERLWVLAEDAAVARELSRKVRGSKSRYEVNRFSGLPEIENLASGLETVDAVLCPAGIRERVEPVVRAAGKELLVVPDTSQTLLYSAHSRLFEDVFVLSVPSLRPKQAALRAKRVLDLVIGSVLFLLAFPVMACVYLAIKIESGGNGFFRQERRGFNGEPFQMLKFRSMVHGAESLSGPVLACVEDPRITPLGRFLRASRLDELPQLWNVLCGEMSLVGPRPEREFFAQQFDESLSDFFRRTHVKPGLTGLAQVWGTYATSAEDKLRLDLLYIANLSLLTDIQILLQTVGTVLRPASARGRALGSESRLALPVPMSDEHQKA